MLVLSQTRTVMDALGGGKVIRRVVASALRILAVLILLFGLYLLIEILKISFRLPTTGTIGGILFGLIFLAGVFAVAQILFYRADSIRELGESPFTVIPIASILFRTAAETYAAFGIAIGVGGCLLIWLTGISPLRLLPGVGFLFAPARGGETFLGGVIFLGTAATFAFLNLLIFYFLAEMIVVIADIARNVRLLVKNGAAPAEK